MQAAKDAATLAALVDRLADAVVVAAPDGTITYWHAAAERVFGWSASDAVGRSLDLIVPERQRHADGSRRSIAFTVTLLSDAIHPPGGATALTSVVAGPAVTSLGYSFVWRPVLLNALTIVAVAVVFNGSFPWRRYPARLARRPERAVAEPTVSHDEVVAALRSIDSFVDITEEDLLRLHRILSHGDR